MAILSPPELAPKPYPFAISTDAAYDFVNSLNPDEARSMLMTLLGIDEGAFLRAMASIQRCRPVAEQAAQVTR
ncbi:hypothetical protein [Microbispora triticiradicis]|uniref:hypothetical protein n=1 Tax=Microbispora triticiradicis TaxID=2200763 RepID=UPI001AD79B25|nr:hypothetical protein [Microbispora triticiradicis]MBO4275093.1 hypothetical protein [Microbispora triticiradicis]